MSESHSIAAFQAREAALAAERDHWRAAAARYRELVDHQQELVVKLDAEGRFVYVSPSYCALFGQPETELLGRPYLPLVHPDDRAATTAAVATLHQPPHHAVIEQRAMTRLGWRWLSWSDRAILDGQGAVTAIIGVGRDVTEHRLLQEANARQQRFLEAVLSAQSSLIIVLDRQGFVHRFNPACTALTGYQLADLAGRPFWEVLVPDEERAGVAAVFGRLRSGDFPLRHENDWCCADGSRRRIAWSNTCTLAPEGEVEWIIGTGIDLTDRHRSTAVLAQRTAEFRQIIDAVPAFICIKNAEGRFELGNRALATALGTTPEALAGASNGDFSATPEEVAGFARDDREVISTRIPRRIDEERVTFADGSVHWFTTLKAPLLEADGSCTRLVAVAMDITHQRAIQSALDSQMRLLNSMLEHLPLGIYMVDAKTLAPLLANQRARDILGSSIRQGPGRGELARGYRAYRAGTSEFYPESDMPLVRAAQGRTHRIDDVEIEREDGTRVNLEVFGCPVPDAEGRPWASLVGFFDINDRRRQALERQRLEQQIQQTQKLESLGVLAGGIAHDFNNILMAIMGHSELAQRKISALSPGREHLHGIEVAAQRAAELCRQMLAYAGKASFASERLDVGDLVDEMGHLLKTSISKKAILNVHIERGLPPIQADPSQIRQIILNLIINASDAIGDRSGVINITVGATRCDAEYLSRTELAGDLPPGCYIHIEVSDTGCGMPPEVRSRIFEPFFTTKFAGRGLGLAAVLGIVKAHHGALKVYSEPNRGTTFKLLFPALGTAASTPPSGIASPEWRGRGTILLVDDEESLRALGAEMLEELGFKVILAEDGRTAVERFEQHPHRIDLVILDLTMPHMDGAQAFGELRRISPDLKVILASGYTREDVAARFAGKGLSGVLQKPFTLAKLTELLSQVLG